MASWIRPLVTAPVFDDEEKTRVARLLNTVLLSFLAAILAAVPLMLFFTDEPFSAESGFTLISAALVAIATAGLLLVARRGRVRFVSAVFLWLLWGIMSFWILTVSGLKGDTSSLFYPMIVVLAGLLLSGRAAIAFTLATVLALSGAFYLERAGHLPIVHTQPTLLDVLFAAVPLFLTGLLLRYAMNNMNDAIIRARRNEQAQRRANQELQEIRASLEERVLTRTRELERRSAQLQAAVAVSRAATSILDVGELMWQVGELIRERFGLYHSALFQLDPSGRWAEYRAGAGQVGRALAEQEFRLEVGGPSMIGQCISRAQVRVVQDVHSEVMRVDHPLLPDTRSEAALPLIVHGQVIGALSVQSDQPGAFDRETMAALETMADQIAIALDNARLFAESQEALRATRRAYVEQAGAAWTELLETRGDWGYYTTSHSVAPLTGEWRPELSEALRTGKPVLRTDSGPAGDPSGESALAIPVRVRDQVVGVLGFYRAVHDRGWSADERMLLEALTDQLGLALENARLYQETQHRAVVERLVGEVATRMRETLDIDIVLQTAVHEMRRALDMAEVQVHLDPSMISTAAG